MPEHKHLLEATCRCLREDLGFQEADCQRPLEELRNHQVVADFLDKRRLSPVGQEVIRALAPKLIAYSLHSGRSRGATWFQEKAAVVWLLAAGLHREGSAEDAYEHFVRLQRAGRLLPTREDIARVVGRRARTFAASLLEEAPRLRSAALATRGDVQEGLLGGRVRIRIVCEPSDPALLSVAVSTKLEPGEMALPPAWLVQVLAAVFPHSDIENISYTDELANQRLRRDEIGFCDFVDA